MSNRGSIRGVVQQPAGGAGPPVPPHRPSVPPRPRAAPSPASATVPQPYRGARGAPRPSGVPTPARPAAPAFRREWVAGGASLDVLDERDAETPPGFGWRRLVRRVTGIDLGRGKRAAYEDGLRERIRTPVGGAFAIAVLNLKGGVGKTSVVEALGSAFARVRDDHVVAVDLDAGNLAERHGRRNALSMAELLSGSAVTRYPDVRAHTYMNSVGLEALGPPDPARTDWRLGRADVVTAFSILRKHYSVVLVDCVKSLNSPVMDAVLPESRALVVVTGVSIDAIRKTKTTLDWLGNNGYRRLLKSTVLAINHVANARVNDAAVKELDELSARVAAVVVLPFDRHVQQGKAIALDRLSAQSRRSYLELAATLADMFPGGGTERVAPQRH
ncbi:MinD/ParA family ATP-binding protein [Mycobacterium sp. HUMS_1102779]|uniref:MinD/ParA family ATP-binding protein n=1 Tax=Mycobacterium sp. HUMS_1102779 TaxID=3383487 RepID=UPI00389A9D65